MNKKAKKLGLFTAAILTATSSMPLSLYTNIDPMSIYASTLSATSFNFDFETDEEGWGPRGSETVAIATDAAYKGSQSLKVTSRKSSWNGPSCNITNLLQEGKTYRFSAWVMYNDSTASNTQTLTLSLACTPTGSSETYKNIVSKSATKGNWTLLEGTYTYTGGMDAVKLYVEGGTMDFYIDNVTTLALDDAKIETDIPSIKEAYDSYFKFGTAITANTLSQSNKDLIFIRLA